MASGQLPIASAGAAPTAPLRCRTGRPQVPHREREPGLPARPAATRAAPNDSGNSTAARSLAPPAAPGSPAEGRPASRSSHQARRQASSNGRRCRRTVRSDHLQTVRKPVAARTSVGEGPHLIDQGFRFCASRYIKKALGVSLRARHRRPLLVAGAHGRTAPCRNGRTVSTRSPTPDRQRELRRTHRRRCAWPPSSARSTAGDFLPAGPLYSRSATCWTTSTLALLNLRSGKGSGEACHLPAVRIDVGTQLRMQVLYFALLRNTVVAWLSTQHRPRLPANLERRGRGTSRQSR
jgi:hypothetical protein